MTVNLCSKIHVKTRKVFVATGETITKGLREGKIVFQPRTTVITADERITNVRGLQNYYRIRQITKYGNFHYEKLMRSTAVQREPFTIIVSIAADGHFASIWPQKQHLDIIGSVVRTIPPRPHISTRLSVSFFMMQQSNLIFCVSDTERLDKLILLSRQDKKLAKLLKFGSILVC